jgi:hypothetical protein
MNTFESMSSSSKGKSPMMTPLNRSEKSSRLSNKSPVKSQLKKNLDVPIENKQVKFEEGSTPQ